MKMHVFQFNGFCENTYLLWDEHTLEAAVVDAGMRTREEQTEFDRYVEAQGVHLTVALQTHCHFDHIFGLPHLHEHYGLLPRYAERESELYHLMPAAARSLGMPIEGELPEPGPWLTEGSPISVGGITLQVIFTPGHTPGGVSFYLPTERMVLTGDTLFRGSMGRTDLGGDELQERRSITERLLTLPPDTMVYPGHGPTTTIAGERRGWGM